MMTGLSLPASIILKTSSSKLPGTVDTPAGRVRKDAAKVSQILGKYFDRSAQVK